MQEVNVEGLYASVQEALKLFGKKKTDGGNDEWKGRIVVVSPPIYSRFFRGKTAYAMGLLSLCLFLFFRSFFLFSFFSFWSIGICD